MSTLIHILLLVILCVYARTENIILFIISFLHLSLCTLGCISVMASNFKSPNLKWEGWIPLIISLTISGVVVYFTMGTTLGIWYFFVSTFWHGACILTKNMNNDYDEINE